MSDGIGAFLTGLNKGVLGSIYSGRRYYSPQTSFATASADLEKKELENVKAQKEFEDLQFLLILCQRTEDLEPIGFLKI